ncbi:MULTISPECIES: PAS domain S-box protein [unclassified Leptolyngbya]|uniref:PAS domain S-box protein n=1 Tax=unclassified Leptolyngbya TaxID=2650499 RepID=UPI001684B614|nr:MULTISPECIES: PAS domain S-box protein [unclassified Leptolyngbya]MBD1909434.1 PAS domain S-box protein [Leptolyngbya sp. FACHB-8]MBD2155669.1 PAS domain S-box protein [Leptolyngbya sp. FACHB-16]
MLDSLTLLLVGGFPADHATYQQFLSQDKRYSYRITEFEKGKDALAWCQSNTADVILVDDTLPDLDGLSFLKALKQQDESVLPVVLLTTGSTVAVIEAMQQGAQNYLDKRQITAESLSQCIHHVLVQTRFMRDSGWQQEQQRLVAAIALEHAKLYEHLQREIIQHQQSEIALHAVFEQSPEGKVRFAPDGSFIAANRAWEEIWEISTDRLVGYNILHDPAVVQEGYLPAVLRAFAGEAVTCPPFFHDPSQFNRPGRSRWIDLLMHPIKNPVGCILEVVMVIRDATDRITLEQEQQRLVQLVEHSPSFIGTATLDGQVTFINPAGQVLVGLGVGKTTQTMVPDYQTPEESQHFYTQVIPAVLSGGQWQGEVRMRHFQTGEQLPVWCNTFTLFNPQTDQPEAIAAVIQDLREKKQTEALLRQQAELLDLAYDAVIAYDISGRITFWNRGAESLYGWTKEQVADHVSHTLFQTQFPISYEVIHAAILEQGYWEGELIHTRQDGQKIITESRHSLIRDTHGQPTLILEINRDITARKQAEHSLRESEEKFRLLIKHAPVRIAMLDCEMRYVTASQRWVNDFRTEPLEALIGQSHYDVFPELPERWKQTHQRCLAGAIDYCEADFFVQPDGLKQWIRREIHPWYHPDNTIGGIIIFSEDITERQRARLNEQFLNQLERRLRQLSDIKAMQWEVVSSLGAYLDLDRCLWCEVDNKHNVVVINQDWRQPDLPSHAGMYSLADVIPLELQALHASGQPIVIADVLTDSHTASKAKFYQQLNIGALIAVSCAHAGYWVATLTGSTRTGRQWQEDEIVLMQDVVSRLWSVIEQTRSLELLRQSEEKFRQLAENTNDVFWISEPEINGVLYINSAYEKVWGRSCESLYADPKSFVDAIHPDDREGFLASGAARATQFYQNEYRVVRPDGSISWVIDKNFPIRNEAGEVYRCCGIVHDITSLKQAEQALQRVNESLEERVAAQTAELQASERLLNAFFEATSTANIGFCIIDNDLRYVKVNETLAAVNGQSVENLVGERVVDSIPDIAAAVEVITRGVLTTRQPVINLEMAAAAPAQPDVIKHWLVSYFPIIQGSDRPDALGCLLLDISDRKQAELDMQASEAALRTLSYITTVPGLSFEQRLEQLFEFGSHQFDLDYGFLACAVGYDYHIVAARTPNEPVMVGKVLDLRQAYCLETLNSPEPICIEHASQSQWCEHPGYTTSGMESYIGMRVQVSNESYGVLYFCSRQPVAKPFKKIDQQILKLMSQWVGSEIEQQRSNAALEQSEVKFRSAFEDAAIGMVLISPAGAMLQVNDSLCKMLGYSEAELLGMDCQPITHPEDRDRYQAYVQQLLNNEHSTCQLEKRYFHKQGHIVWTILSMSLVRDIQEQPLYFVAQIEDITGLKQAEQQLYQLNAQLQESNRELESFAFIASHDLKEPLRTVRNFSTLLQLTCGKALNDEGKDYLARIDKATQRMQALIDDLLRLSRVATTTAPFVSVNLNQVMEQVIANLQEQAQRTGGQIRVGTLPTIEADPGQMTQLLQNLVSNALKFHGASPPVVNVYGDQNLGSLGRKDCGNTQYYRLCVEDNGIGFDPQYCDRIFGAFERLHGRSEYEGTGIGLAICKKIVERHGGTIEAHSIPGQGATFILTLPQLTDA